MEYEQKYEEVLGRVKELLDSAKNHGHIIVRVEDIEDAFPEIQENKDEKIRKEIVDFITSSNKYGTNERCEAWLNWLEKQSEKDPCIGCTNNKGCITCENGNMKETIKSKFNEGDYIVPYNTTPLEIWKVVNIDKDGYYNIQPIINVINTEDDKIYRVPGFIIEEDYRLWSINDAKDGDVLVDEDNNIGLYSGEKNDLDWQSCIYLGCDGYLRGAISYHKRKNTKPATKEQRYLLFQKMKEAGYKWYSEKKELKKDCTVEPI